MNRHYRLAARTDPDQRTLISIGSHIIGGDRPTLIAGPCAVESPEQIEACAALCAELDIPILRGGAFKPRTSPYSFQGLGEKGLAYLREAADRHKLAVVAEVLDHDQLERALDYLDIVQIGSRNMQNFSLLKRLGTINRPLLLKRGSGSTYEELLLSAEYILQGGNPNVILCERGIRTFEPSCRNTLDIGAVPMLHELSHLPVIVDPSHGIGIRKMVPPLARAAIAAGADGLMLEVHPDPDRARSDGAQSLSLDELTSLIASLPRAAVSASL